MWTGVKIITFVARYRNSHIYEGSPWRESWVNDH